MTQPEASGRLSGPDVLVEDEAEANRLYNRHSVGIPLTGNKLSLSLVEAAWCVEGGRMQVSSDGRDFDLPAILEQGSKEGGGRMEVEFLAYRDMRERGLVVRHSVVAGEFSVWQRGEGPPKQPWFTLEVRAERDAVPVSDLVAWAEVETVIGIVDEDGGLTYYRLARAEPQGDVPEGLLPPATGVLLEDRVLVADAVAARTYAEKEAMGTRIGERLVLSLTEAEALRRRGVLSVSSELVAHAHANQPHFDRALPVYMDLRRRGVVAKSGLKFGTHLRAYRSDPDRDHAEWLIQCAAPDSRLNWSELARAVRVAHGVRKAFLVAEANAGINYIELGWFRP